MISFNSASNKNKDPDKVARLAGIRQISDWVENELPEEEQETTSVMVNQIECAAEQHGQSALPGSAAARLLCLFRARLAALGSSALRG